MGMFGLELVVFYSAMAADNQFHSLSQIINFSVDFRAMYLKSQTNSSVINFLLENKENAYILCRETSKRITLVNFSSFRSVC